MRILCPGTNPWVLFVVTVTVVPTAVIDEILTVPPLARPRVAVPFPLVEVAALAQPGWLTTKVVAVGAGAANTANEPLKVASVTLEIFTTCPATKLWVAVVVKVAWQGDAATLDVRDAPPAGAAMVNEEPLQVAVAPLEGPVCTHVHPLLVPNELKVTSLCEDCGGILLGKASVTVMPVATVAPEVTAG